jgi:hypothetical protein
MAGGSDILLLPEEKHRPRSEFERRGGRLRRAFLVVLVGWLGAVALYEVPLKAYELAGVRLPLLREAAEAEAYSKFLPGTTNVRVNALAHELQEVGAFYRILWLKSPFG